MGEELSRSGALTAAGLKAALEWQKANGGTIERALLATRSVTEESLVAAVSASTGMPGVCRETLVEADPWAVAALPAEARRRLRALPFEKRGGELLVAVADPHNPVLVTGLVAASGYEVQLHSVPEPVLDDLLAHWERREAERAQVPAARPEADEGPPTEAIENLGRVLLADALRGGADAFELGTDRRGGYSRTHHYARPPLTRRLPEAVVRQLLGWFRLKLKAADPFGGASFNVEVEMEVEGRTRLLVELTESGAEGMRFHFRSLGPAAAGPGTPPCRHERAGADVFCPDCGAPL